MPIGRDYGPMSRTLLQVATSRGWCTQESLAAYLTAQLRGPESVSRATVASWECGREHVPGDVVLHLAKHTGRSVELMQVLVEGLGLLVVPRPASVASPDDVLVVASRASGRLGRLLEHLVGERSASSDGGSELTEAELQERLELVGGAEGQLAQIRATTEGQLAALRSRRPR